MQPERRFVFRGNAAAVSGQIYRPDITIFEATGASSLTVSGGISQGRLGKTALGKFGTVGAGRTRAEGVFVDRGQATELTHHRIKAEQVPTQTKVEVEVQGIEVGLAPDPILRVERLAATMEGRSPRST